MELPTDRVSTRVQSFPALYRAERRITVFRRDQLSPKDDVGRILLSIQCQSSLQVLSNPLECEDRDRYWEKASQDGKYKSEAEIVMPIHVTL